MAVPLMAAAAVAGPILGGIFGNLFAQGDSAEARRQQQAALQEWINLKKPSPEELKVVYDELRRVGRYTPEMEQVFKQSDSEMKKISVDPRLKQAQLKALMKLQEIGDQGGMDIESKAALEQARNEAAGYDKSQRESIMQNMQARGMSGSGAELAAMLSAQQGGSNRMAQAGFNAAADARRRALAAIAQSGELGGQMRGQEFGEQSAIAQAQDAINRFNTSAMQDVSTRNINRRNEGNLYNLNEDQRVADQNVNIRNKQRDQHVAANQQLFENDTKVAAGTADAYTNSANQAEQRASDTRKMWSGIGQGVGKGFAAYNMASKKRKPWDEEDEE